ncbi:vpu protein [Human immunodeficiency virus 1]|uniref:Protein Vpu n=1 Tax=Human immunodeficiency virus type 1 TaxID=11676 RepID=Q66Q71_HV1|nr:vpu protein [Human immunodeficiency virus 1]AAU08229.1 vpu protein [Human immunodeficiency virus 1]
MQHRDLITLIIISALLLINIILWMFILKQCIEQKKQSRREREIIERLRRIRKIQDDSDYESNGEEEQEVRDLVHSHGFDNPMFEP